MAALCIVNDVFPEQSMKPIASLPMNSNINRPEIEDSKPRLVGTALTTLVAISSLATIISAAIRCKHGANYLVGLSPMMFTLPLVSGASFFAYYIFRRTHVQKRLINYCLLTAISVALAMFACDFYASKEQAIDAGNPRVTDNATLVSYGIFTRRFELSFKGERAKTVTVTRTIAKFISALPFTDAHYADKFTFDAFNAFGWEEQ